MIVLDTNVISETLRPHPEPQVVSWLEQLTGDVAVTAVTVAEVLAGTRRLPAGRRRDSLAREVDVVVDHYLGTDRVLPFGSEAALHYADILVAREHAGRPISMADAQIAAICRSSDATCATRNVKDFAGTGILIVNPWEA